MTAQQTDGTAAELEELLHAEAGLVSRLYNCICAEESALVDDRLEAIQRAVESQEELSASLTKMENNRRTLAQTLARNLALEDDSPTLRALAERLPDAEQAQRLTAAGNRLSDMLEKLRRKNQGVRGILSLKHDYTETLLNLIAGVDDTPGRNYGDRGQILHAEDPGPGMYEVTI